ncbi:hypothetical protein [Clostridium butyricum]|nr:hypothetical protein [Clostridium butyricum]
MEAFHKLKVESPYEILEIEDIKISNNPNEHGRLYLKALLDDSINFKYAIEASTDDKISIYEETEDKEKSIIFNGTIQNIRTENINGIYYMEIEAYTSSFELDIKEKSRSFQDAEMSYDDLIKTILLDYKIYSFTQRMDKPMSIGRPLFQYKETDYEFLKRVASQIGLEINCDIINTNNVFYFGRPWGKEYKIEDNIDYEALKDIKKYRESLVHSPNFHDTDFFYYKIRTRKVMELGAQVVFKQKKFYINSYEAEYVRGELIYTYKLCRERGIWQEKLYNDKIKGISLEGEVLEVSGEKVKLHLDIDETQNKDKAAWFSYAPPTGNLMYSMPIVGTNANLYFSSERSEDPIVIGCIRKNGSSCESFSDVNNRYFSTESGNNLDMLPGAINFSRPGLSANFNDGSGINLSSSSSLNISAGYVGIYAGDITIKAKSKLEAKKGESSFISLENDFYNNAGIVMENGSDKASNGAFDDDPQKGAAEAKKAKAAMESAVKVALAAVVGAVQGAMGKIGECLAGVGNNASSTSNVDLRDTLNKPWANAGMDGTRIKSGYDVYREKTYNYFKTSKPYATDSQIYGDIARSAPWKYKFKAIGDYIFDYSPIAQGKKYFNIMALNYGMESHYAELYSDFTIQSIFETGFTIAGKGLKAASALKSGEALLEGEIVAGSGIGNLKGTEGVSKAVDDIFNNGKKVLDNFEIDNAYVKPKHLSTTKGKGQQFLGNNKVEAEIILKDTIKNGAIKSITDNGITRAGNESYEIIIDAGKEIGTRGETLVKIVLSEDGGMLSAYPIK